MDDGFIAGRVGKCTWSVENIYKVWFEKAVEVWVTIVYVSVNSSFLLTSNEFLEF